MGYLWECVGAFLQILVIFIAFFAILGAIIILGHISNPDKKPQKFDPRPIIPKAKIVPE